MDYTNYTLGILLSAKDKTIKRNAISILKRLQENRIEGCIFNHDHAKELEKCEFHN